MLDLAQLRVSRRNPRCCCTDRAAATFTELWRCGRIALSNGYDSMFRPSNILVRDTWVANAVG